MRSLSRVEMEVTAACGFVIVALMLAICCLLWWAKKAISSGLLEVCVKPGRDILLRVLFSGKKEKENRATSSTDVDDIPCQICSSVIIDVHQLEYSTTSDDEDDDDEETESSSVEDESCWGPPYFLCTIKEETEEEMKAALAEEEEESSFTILADFLDHGCHESSIPKSAAPLSLAKLNSVKVGGKICSVPFQPPSVAAAQGINDSCHCSSSADAINRHNATIVVE